MNITVYNPAIHYPKRNRTMKSGSYRRSAYFLLACFILLTAACGEQKLEVTSTYPYKRDGIILTLPEEWEVIEDVLHDSNIRTVAILTGIGSTVTIDIYHKAFYEKPLPTLDEYSISYIQSSLRYEEARAKAKIDSGEVRRGSSRGVFYDITLSEPFNVQYMLEFHPKQSPGKLAYITFNTRQEHLGGVQQYIDEFVQYTDLGQ